MYWAACNSSEFVIPQRRYDLCLLLLPVRILYNIPERSLNTRSFAPFLMQTRGGVKTGYSTFFTSSLHPLSDLFIFTVGIDTCVMVACVIALLKESFLCSVLSETLDVSWIWTFAENLLSKSFQILPNNNNLSKWRTTLSENFFSIFIVLIYIVKTTHYVSQFWVK